MRRLVILFLLLFPALSIMAQGERTNCFHAEITSIQPLKYPSRIVSEFSLEMRGDTIEVHLPYVGDVYSASLNNDGLNFSTKVNNLRRKESKNGIVSITFEAKYDRVDYRFRLTLVDNGIIEAYLTTSNAQSCSYGGTWDPLKP